VILLLVVSHLAARWLTATRSGIHVILDVRRNLHIASKSIHVYVLRTITVNASGQLIRAVCCPILHAVLTLILYVVGNLSIHAA
jgi:hypothetical protein